MRPRVDVRPVLAAAFAGVVAIAIAKDFMRRDTTGIDFHTYLAAAIVGMRDGWSNLYDESTVAAAQRALDSQVWAQPFLSTPPVAFIVAPLSLLSYPAAYLVWGLLTLAAFAGALAWSSPYGGGARWLAAAAGVVSWWVIHSVHIGQVAPLVAASVVVAWRLLREDRDVAAGLVLAVLLLKPNTAFLVPVALVFTARWRALGAWLAASVVIGVATLLLIGAGGALAYLNAITHVSEAALRGASVLTIATFFPHSPVAALAFRVAILAVAVAAMYRYRREPGMAIGVGALASLLVATYLHGSDLCLLTAAGWIVWHERPAPAWRALLAGMWVLSTPFLDGSALAPALNRWVVCELVLLGAFAVDAFLPRREALTAWAASRSRAHA